MVFFQAPHAVTPAPAALHLSTHFIELGHHGPSRGLNRLQTEVYRQQTRWQQLC